MKIADAYPSKYLSAANIPDDSDLIYTISRADLETVGQGKDAEEKPVLYFEESDKGLILNKTNSGTITAVLKSGDTDDWVGKKIALFATEVDFQGKQILAIRVRLRLPASAKPARPKLAAAAVVNEADGSEAGAEDIPF